MANVQVRGCCCGIPFGCGALAVILGLLAFAGGWHWAVAALVIGGPIALAASSFTPTALPTAPTESDGVASDVTSS